MISSPAEPTDSNPFCTRFVRPGQIEFQFNADDDTGWPSSSAELVDRLQQVSAGLIVGPHGSGKSTLLCSLDRWLRESFDQVVKLHLHAPDTSTLLHRLQNRRVSARRAIESQQRLSRGGLLIIDGLEQLGFLDRIRLLRRARRRQQTLLATAHAPLAGLTTLYRTQIDVRLVRSLTEQLVAGAPPELAKMVRGELDRQNWSTLTNVRQLWFELYDLVQPHVSPSIVRSGSTQFLPLRDSRDGRSPVRHHGPHLVAESGGRLDS